MVLGDFGSKAIVILTVIVSAGLLLTVMVIDRQPVDDIELTFKVPLVPFLPCVSILINLYLMFQLDGHTWIRFGVWIAVGYLIYFTYGIRKSTEGALLKSEKDDSKQTTVTLNSSASQVTLPVGADIKEEKKIASYTSVNRE